MFQVKRHFGIWYHQSLCGKVANRYNVRRVIKKVRDVYKALVAYSITRKHLARAFSKVVTNKD